jgi:DNA gyrase subunit A
MAIRFEEEDVRPMGRPAYGVRGMDLEKGDYIVGMAVTPKKIEAAPPPAAGKKAAEGEAAEVPAEAHYNLILSVTENGYGKRTDVDEYRLQSRGGKGVINVKTTARNGKVVSIMLVDEGSEAMVISQFGKIIRVQTKEIREAGRSTQGVRLLQLEPGDRLAAAVVIPPEERNGNGTVQ